MITSADRQAAQEQHDIRVEVQLSGARARLAAAHAHATTINRYLARLRACIDAYDYLADSDGSPLPHGTGAIYHKGDDLPGSWMLAQSSACVAGRSVISSMDDTGNALAYAVIQRRLRSLWPRGRRCGAKGTTRSLT
jgi:hypothetical protein